MANASHRQPIGLPAALSTRAARIEPFDWYREMRRESPVRYDDDRGVWDVFRHDDATRVLGDTEAFSESRAGVSGTERDEHPLQSGPSSSAPSRHTWVRSLVDDRFRAETVGTLAPYVRAVADELLDDAVADGRVDAVADLAAPMAVIATAELLGVSPDDRDRLGQWSRSLVADPGVTERRQAAGDRTAETIREMRAYFAGLVEQRRALPRDDLLTHIGTADPDGHRPTDEAVLDECVRLLVGRAVATAGLVGNAVLSFDDRSSVYGGLADNRDGLGDALEEVLRYRSPVQAVPRVATAEAELRGHTIEAGDRVVVWAGSANRDGRRFADPEAFRPTRRPTEHVTVGYGHHCRPGSPLTRLQARVALERLFDRVVDIERADEPLDPMPGAFRYGVERLPLRVDPGT